MSEDRSNSATITADPLHAARTEKMRSHPVRLVVILAGIAAFGPLTTDLYLPGLPEIGRAFDITTSEAQLTLTACVIGLAVGQLVAGPLSDTFGRRRPLLVGLALFVAASVVCSLSPSIVALDIARLVQGLAGAVGIVISRAIVRDLYSGPTAGRYFSAIAAVIGVAPIVAPLAGGQLLRVMPWQGVFLVLAGIGVILLLLVVRWIPESLHTGQRRPLTVAETGRTFAVLLGDRRFLGYALGGGLAFGAMFSYISASSFVYQDLYGISPQLYSLLFGLNSAGLMTASILNGWLLTRVGMTRLLGVGLGMTASGGIALLLCVLAGLGIAGIVPCLFVAISGIGFILSNTVALAMADHGRVAGSASALLGVIPFAAGAVMAPVVGLAGVSALPMAIAMAVLGPAAIVAVRLGTLSRR